MGTFNERNGLLAGMRTGYHVPGEAADMSRYLIVLAMVVLGVALFWPTLKKLGFGRLPGDVVIQRKSGVQFYLPFASVLILSWLLNALVWFFNH